MYFMLARAPVIVSTFVVDMCKMCIEGQLDQVLEVMEQQGVRLTRNLSYYLLQACEKRKGMDYLRRVQFLMDSSGLDSLAVLNDHVIRLFASSACLHEANIVFSKVAKPTPYTWSAIMSANTSLGQGGEAIELYQKMQLLGMKCDRHVYLAAVKACSISSSLPDGKLVHGDIIKGTHYLDLIVENSLVDMYAKCGSLEEACKVFYTMPVRDVVSWGAMIGGYAHNGEGIIALDFFGKMQEGGVQPTNVTFSAALKACCIVRDIQQGRSIHREVLKCKLQNNVFIGNTIVDMYAKCGSLGEACDAFHSLTERNVVSWNAMLGGYIEHGESVHALELFSKMSQDGAMPDEVTFLNALKACGNVGAIEHGKVIHHQIMTCGLQADITMGNTIIDMYAKCGSMMDAYEIFTELLNKDLISWGAMIAGHAQRGETSDALQLLEKMEQKCIEPDEAIFTSIFIACSRESLVEEGYWYFNFMDEQHGMKPNVSHFNCMADLLGRAGYFTEAEDLLRTTIWPNVIGWASLLNACRIHGNMELGRLCFDRVTSLDCHGIGSYVLMSNIYADSDMEESMLSRLADAGG